jgi:hypothetical protein
MVPLVNSAKFNNDSVDVSSKITDRFILYPVLTDKQTNKQTNKQQTLDICVSYNRQHTNKADN